MGKQKSYPLLTALGAGIGAWAAVKVIQQVQVAQQPHFFEGKVVLITGASRGLGQAFAHEFARRGAHLVLAARKADQLKIVAQECEALNARIETLSVPTDVTDQAQLQTLLAQAVERFGYIDILVNNAGIRQGGSLLELGAESIQRQLDVNLMAPINLTLLALPSMLARQKGHIVNISSNAGQVVEPYFIPYGTSKHGLLGFSEGLRRELAGTGISVLTVNPGFFDTDMVTDIGPVYEKMGFTIASPEAVAKQTLDAIILGLPEVNTSIIETAAGKLNQLLPAAVDLFWRFLMPSDFPEKATQQHTD